MPKLSNCGYHNRVKAGEELQRSEAIRHGFCKERNAYRCRNESCPGHAKINK